MNKTVWTSFTILCLLSTASLIGLAFNIQTVKASETIYIRADGSVEPSATPISSVDNVTYTLTDNINDSVVVERSNIIIDGNRYTLEGPGYMGTNGFYLSAIKNVTITKINIKGFTTGVYLNSASDSIISGNNITMRKNGIFLDYSSNNAIVGNNITNNYDVVTCCYIAIRLEDSNSNTISGNKIINATVRLDGSSDNIICGNDVTGVRNAYSLYLEWSSSNTISENKISNNNIGIGTFESSSNTVSNNNITGNNRYGIVLMNSSDENSVSRNNVVDNGEVGIFLWHSSYNFLRNNSLADNLENFGVVGWELSNFINEVDSSNTINKKPIYYWLNKRDMTAPHDAGYLALINCTNIKVTNLNLQNNSQGILLVYTTNSTITQNNIVNNHDGIRLYWSPNNKFYHNNFIGNHHHVDIETSGYANFWDNGVEGNYWSNYTGADSDCPLCFDGIGDFPHVIDEDNTDNRPLMGMLSSFNSSSGYYVNVISNSTLEDFEYVESNSTIKMYASNMTADQTHGFCRLRIPHDLLSPPYNVTINDNSVLQSTVYENETLSIIYFNYEHSTVEIVIIPEFTDALILPLVIVMTLVIVIFYRVHKKNPCARRNEVNVAYNLLYLET